MSVKPPNPLTTLDKFLADIRKLNYVGNEDLLTEIFWDLYPATTSYGYRDISKAPISSKLLMGPTGAGKTRLVEVVSEVVHGHSNGVIVINCGEFQFDHEVAKLIGAPPGYLGHKETTPRLTQAKLNLGTSEQCDISFILFDEIEKAAPSMHRLFLGMLDDNNGTISLGDGSSVKFNRSYVFFTSNLGVKTSKTNTIGYTGTQNKNTEVKLERYITAAKDYFPPEFINRVSIDNIKAIPRLSYEQAANIVKTEINRLGETLLALNIFISHVGKNVIDYVLSVADWENYGGRSIRKIVKKFILTPIMKFRCENAVTFDKKSTNPKTVAIYCIDNKIEVGFNAASVSG